MTFTFEDGGDYYAIHADTLLIASEQSKGDEEWRQRKDSAKALVSQANRVPMLLKAIDGVRKAFER